MCDGKHRRTATATDRHRDQGIQYTLNPGRDRGQTRRANDLNSNEAANVSTNGAKSSFSANCLASRSSLQPLQTAQPHTAQRTKYRKRGKLQQVKRFHTKRKHNSHKIEGLQRVAQATDSLCLRDEQSKRFPNKILKLVENLHLLVTMLFLVWHVENKLWIKGTCGASVLNSEQCVNAPVNSEQCSL